MEQITLAFQERSELRKSASRRLRTSGRVPAVIYGQGAPLAISVDSHEFSTRFSSFGENTVIKLQSGKSVYEVLVKDYQDNLLTGQVQHIDFYHISATKALHTKVPIHVDGTAVGVRNGGLMETVIHEVEVECLAKDIPQGIRVDVTDLDIGSSIKVGDLPSAKGVKILTNADAILVHIVFARNTIEVPVVETAAVADVATADSKEAPAKASPEKKG